MQGYIRPDTLGEALSVLGAGPVTVVAGGTDIYPACVGRPGPGDVLDISGIASLRGIATGDDGFRIGALVTWSEILDAPLPPLFDGLKLAAREIGGVQIQNTATLCGNLCNASPAADGMPNFLALNAEVEIAGAGGVRRLPVARFVTGNRQTGLADGEIVTAVIVPRHGRRARSTFEKLGARRYLVISIAMVAALVEVDDAGRIITARIAVGACSVVACRLSALEDDLIGRSVDHGLAGLVQPDHLAPLSPIDDIRASAAYRLDAALTLVRRALTRLAIS